MRVCYLFIYLFVYLFIKENTESIRVEHYIHTLNTSMRVVKSWMMSLLFIGTPPCHHGHAELVQVNGIGTRTSDVAKSGIVE
jgi:hypothetical protein